MNIFSAFTFGSLIKTFLPGFVLLAALVLLEADAAELLYGDPIVWTYVKAHFQDALILSFPISILLGLFTNIIVFMGPLDSLVRGPFATANPGLKKLYDGLAMKLKQKCWQSLQGIDGWDEREFFASIDPDFTLLNLMDVQKLMYVRDQYWYHLEFQLNLIISSSILLAAAVGSCVINVPNLQHAWPFISSIGIAVLLAIEGLLLAARKNYARHISKLASVMAAVLCSPGPDETGLKVGVKIPR